MLTTLNDFGRQLLGVYLFLSVEWSKNAPVAFLCLRGDWFFLLAEEMAMAAVDDEPPSIVP